jgi:hypothetical protein
MGSSAFSGTGEPTRRKRKRSLRSRRCHQRPRLRVALAWRASVKVPRRRRARSGRLTTRSPYSAHEPTPSHSALMTHGLASNREGRASTACTGSSPSHKRPSMTGREGGQRSRQPGPRNAESRKQSKSAARAASARHTPRRTGSFTERISS